MSTLDTFGRDFDPLELDPGEAADDYIPTETYRGSTRPFRPAPVVIARPAAVVERPGPDGEFLAGFEELPWSAIWFTAFLVVSVLYAVSMVRP